MQSLSGLLVARAYALCRGGKVVAIVLALAFFAGVLFLLLGKQRCVY